MKGAYIEEAVYLGDDQIDALVNIKSKDELIGEIITLLQSPAKMWFLHLNQVVCLAGIIKRLLKRKHKIVNITL